MTTFTPDGVTIRVLRDLLGRHPSPSSRPSTSDICSHVIKPSTAARSCAYVDLLRDGPDVGKATWFVSHAWGVAFEDLVSTLEVSEWLCVVWHVR